MDLLTRHEIDYICGIEEAVKMGNFGFRSDEGLERLGNVSPENLLAEPDETRECYIPDFDYHYRWKI